MSNNNKTNTNSNRFTGKKRGRKPKKKLEKEELITFEEFAWTDIEGFRFDYVDPIKNEEYNDVL